MLKDFLFLDYSYVPNSRILFNKFAEKGHTIDIVDETQIMNFIPEHQYKNVVVYLHEGHMRQKIDSLIANYFQGSFIIQHDDTDSDYMNHWTDRMADLFMQRELMPYTQMDTASPVYPFHFPIPSIYDEKFQTKDIDVVFMGCDTNARRRPFIDHIMNLSQNELKHLNWHIKFTRPNDRTPGEFKEMCNRAKICLNYWGNSYDSIRIWEVISAKAALVMPKLPNISTSEGYMPFTEYCVIKDNYEDLAEKITYLLDSGRWKTLGEEGYEAYQLRHNPDKVFEQYYKNIMKHCNK